MAKSNRLQSLQRLPCQQSRASSHAPPTLGPHHQPGRSRRRTSLRSRNHQRLRGRESSSSLFLPLPGHRKSKKRHPRKRNQPPQHRRARTNSRKAPPHPRCKIPHGPSPLRRRRNRRRKILRQRRRRLHHGPSNKRNRRLDAVAGGSIGNPACALSFDIVFVQQVVSRAKTRVLLHERIDQTRDCNNCERVPILRALPHAKGRFFDVIGKLNDSSATPKTTRCLS